LPLFFQIMRLYLIAGEASGDLHGSNLLKALYAQRPDLSCRFWGGDLMQNTGATLVKHYRDLAFMGFVEVIKNLRTILRNIAFCKQDILDFKPDALVLIDYPGFNLRIARWAKEQHIPVIYYISPQLWAWHASRAHAISRDVDKLLVILPFEQAFFQTYGIEAEFVGHPLLDELGLVSGELVSGGLVSGGLVNGGLVNGGLVSGGLVNGGVVNGGVVSGRVENGNMVSGEMISGDRAGGLTPDNSSPIPNSPTTNPPIPNPPTTNPPTTNPPTTNPPTTNPPTTNPPIPNPPIPNPQSPIPNQIALLPGSRKQEVSRILPKMLEMVDDFPDYEFVIAGATSLPEAYYQQFLGKHPKVQLVRGKTYEILRQSKAALVKSGTSTLETALLDVPQVVCYSGNWISYKIAKQLIKVKYISLVNLIMDRPLVRELIQDELNPKNLRAALAEILTPEKSREIKAGYAELRKCLGDGGASKRAATAILKALS
jgi:lipid A disaccharide synthetase